MRNRFLAGAGSSAAALTLLFVPSASAATEFGDDCSASFAIGGRLVATSAFPDPGSTLPLTAPAGGVITQWGTNIADEVIAPGQADERAVLLRPVGTPNRFVMVATSEPEPVAAGKNFFMTRIPVQAGDRLALAGNGSTLVCVTGDPLDKLLFTNNLPSPGTTIDFDEIMNVRAPISARIEPDADNDGFGDETQDGCPQSAAFQAACPLVTVSGVAVPGKGSVSVFVATDIAAPVSVSGIASLGKGKKASLTATPRTLAAGQVTRFVLKFPKKLGTSLAALPPKRKLTLQITASATNVAGQVSTDGLGAKLKGQK